MLNDPNIAAIYRLEKSAGTTALVMELVEGDDLLQRIARLRAPGTSAATAGLPLDDVLSIARPIAVALEAGHELGIIHLDLKPANIKVRPSGVVKMLDFGLAKAIDPVGRVPSNVTNSPTITSPALTAMGMILGAAAYMAPEQAKGRPSPSRPWRAAGLRLRHPGTTVHPPPRSGTRHRASGHGTRQPSPTRPDPGTNRDGLPLPV